MALYSDIIRAQRIPALSLRSIADATTFDDPLAAAIGVLANDDPTMLAVSTMTVVTVMVTTAVVVSNADMDAGRTDTEAYTFRVR